MEAVPHGPEQRVGEEGVAVGVDVYKTAIILKTTKLVFLHPPGLLQALQQPQVNYKYLGLRHLLNKSTPDLHALLHAEVNYRPVCLHYLEHRLLSRPLAELAVQGL